MEFSVSQKAFIKELFDKLNETIDKKTTTLNNTINEKAAEIRTELKVQIGDIKEEFDTALLEFKNKITNLEDQNNKLKNRILHLERKTRKNNIVIFGISETEINLWEAVIRLFKNILQIEILESDINDIYRVGKQKDSQKTIVVEFVSFQKKLLVLKNTKKLKGNNIYIAKDQCWEDQETNKILLKHKNEARKKGATAYIKGQALIVNNETYTLNQLEENELELNLSPIKPDSAPSTPNPERRQRQLAVELGLGEIDVTNLPQGKPLNRNKIREQDNTTGKEKVVTRSISAVKKK